MTVAVILWRVGNVYETYHRSGIEEDLPIYSLRDRIELHGGFVLGTGSIDQEDYYAFYTKGEFGRYKKQSVPAEDVEVIMRNDVKPRLKTLWIDDEQQQFLFVPKNTIKRQIAITT